MKKEALLFFLIITGREAMHCHECGSRLQGKFCSNCGVRALSSPAPVVDSADSDTLEVLPSWQHELRYEILLQYPEVRAAIEREVQVAKKGLTGEQFLALADKLVPQVVSMEGLATVAHTLLTRLGIKTDRRREELLPMPVGEVLTRTLCSLARHGQSIERVTQATDGCLIEAIQPSDVWSLAGSLVITVRRSPSNIQTTELSAVATITGQLFDWGKNHRSLERLFIDVRQELALLPKAA